MLVHEENNMDIDQASNEWKDQLVDTSKSIAKIIRDSNNNFHKIAAEVDRFNVI